MTIKVYPSVMPGAPEEIYHDHGLTIEDFIAGHAEGYRRGPVQRVSCAVNGEIIDPRYWQDKVIGPRDSVDIRVKPFGDVVQAFINPVAYFSVKAGQAALKYLAPDLPGQNGGGQQGAQIDPATAKANTARPGAVIPQLFGRHIRFPDYLNQTRRYYQDTRTQVLELFLSVTPGEIEPEADLVKIGETPMSELNGVTYQIFPPGADVSGVSNHENWFNSPEVGGTQSGNGIRLRGITFDERTYDGPATASGSTLSGIEVDEPWSAGVSGAVLLTQSVSVADGSGAGVADPITGNFQHLLAGMTVNAISDVGVSGTYVVTSINAGKTEITLETTGGTPLSDLVDGTGISGTMAIDKAGTKYEITAINSPTSVDVKRILASGAADPDWVELPTASVTADIDWQADTFTASKIGPYTACPEGETTSVVEVDILASQGLGTVDGESINARSRTITIEYREQGGAAWTAVSKTVSGATRDQLGWTFPITLPSAMRPEFRFDRVGGEDVSVTSLDRLEVTGLRAKLPTRTSYPDLTTMAVTIVGSEEIASQSENRVNLVGTRKLAPCGGGPIRPTRSIADAVYHMAKSSGYDDSRIDIAELQRLDAIWQPRGDYFDHVFQETTLEEAINTALRAGFAELTAPDGVLTPVRDEPRTQFEQPYSPENMTGPLKRSFKSVDPEEFDGVEVEFFDSRTWTRETVLCLLPGDPGVKLDKIKLDGVTDRTRSWRIGMRRRRAKRYRRWSYSFNTELDALNSNYLSYVPLVDDIPDYGKACVLRGVDSSGATPKLIVSEPMDWQAGETYVVAYRDVYGDLVGPFPATRGDDDFEIIADVDPLPELSPRQEPPHVYFGTAERWSFPALVTEISPGSGLGVGVQATNYDGRVYADDDNAPT
ncbi:hypothetical protein BKP64_11025 [Marinobacter salinus]|uniref:Tip attachment protein J HDII-ins2 domain-containing protein n=1 Tax=Marinobacter salinus TaxID=1874317 RepID=A0A1D9GM92_9GAMM|nr:MoaD/ThiS family protein [Marinobacter salinus]AOY88661.1 hypothetical protein BKP64_11025 [Marinobacter salinus]